MANEQDLMAALRRADAAGDTEGAKRIASMIQKSRQPASASGEDAGALYAAIHGVEDTATFGLGDKAAAAIAAGASHLIPGIPNQSYDEALRGITGRSEASAAAHPVSALAGDAAGLVAGGGVINTALKGAKAIPVVGKGAAAIADALSPVKGQAVRNVLKSAAVGGAVGAGDATARGGNADQVLESGAVSAVASPVVSKVATVALKALSPAAQKAMSLLAEKIGEKPAVLQRAFDNFRATTGRVPTMAELVGLKTQGELRQVAADNPTVGEAITKARDIASSERAQSLPRRIDQVAGPTQDISQLVTARTQRMDAAMTPIRAQRVQVQDTEVPMLLDPRVRDATRQDPELRRRIADVITDVNDTGVSNRLTIDDIDNIRKSLRGRQTALANPNNQSHNPHIAAKYGELADDIAALGAAADHRYAAALQQYGTDSDYIHGFKHGNAGKELGDAEQPHIIQALGRLEGQRGYASGVASRLASGAGESEAGAVRTAAAMGEGTGTTRQMHTALGGTATQQLAEAGATEAKGANALDTIAPGAPRPGQEESGIQHAAHVAAAATYHSPTAIGYHLSRLFGGKLKLSEAVQRKVAQYLADPKMTQQGINLLRKAGATNADLRTLATAISGATGATIANTVVK
jgi:hypothetical protein